MSRRFPLLPIPPHAARGPRTNGWLLVLVWLATIPGCAPSPNGTATTRSAASSKLSSAIAGKSLSSKSRTTADSPKTQTKTANGSLSTKNPSQPSLPIDELLLFFPSKYPRGNWQPNGLKFFDVWFTTDDHTRIHGWYCPCENARAVVLFAHGNAGNLSRCSSLLTYLQTELRVTVLVFDYRGYGRSAGVPTVAGILKDARAASRFLAQRAGIAESEIVVMGRSLGGTVACHLAAETQPRGLILESTFSSLKDVATHRFPKLAWLVSPQKLNSAAVISRYKGPLLQCHGDDDRTVPFASGMKLFRAANEPKTFVTIPGGGHNDRRTEIWKSALNRFINGLPNR